MLYTRYSVYVWQYPIPSYLETHMPVNSPQRRGTVITSVVSYKRLKPS